MTRWKRWECPMENIWKLDHVPGEKAGSMTTRRFRCICIAYLTASEALATRRIQEHDEID